MLKCSCINDTKFRGMMKTYSKQDSENLENWKEGIRLTKENYQEGT